MQEFHLTKTYHDGLLKLQAKEYEKARELLESVLKDHLIESAQVWFFLKVHSARWRIVYGIPDFSWLCRLLVKLAIIIYCSSGY